MLTSTIREGSDIYFVCHVDAVPSIKEITWLHNDKPINETILTSPHHKQKSDEHSVMEQNHGLIISTNNSLVLQKIRIEQRGLYACMAFNSEGITESNRIELKVLRK